MILDLAKLFTVPSPRDLEAPAGFCDAFRSQDETFGARGNRHELRVLAGAVLRLVVDQGGPAATLAALGIVCGAFGSRAALVPVPEHIDAAERFLMRQAKIMRQRISPVGIKLKAPSKSRFSEIIPAAVFAQNSVPHLQEPLWTALSELSVTLSSLATQAQKSLDQLTRTIVTQQEEINILWWLQTRYSTPLGKPFADVGRAAGVLVFPMEIADLTESVPGPDAVIAVLVHALSLAGNPTGEDQISITEAVNVTSRDWREKVRAKHVIGQHALLCPVILALEKSLETLGEKEWIPVYRAACDISAEASYGIIPLALQVYRERMLLDAAREGGS